MTRVDREYPDRCSPIASNAVVYNKSRIYLSTNRLRFSLAAHGRRLCSLPLDHKRRIKGELGLTHLFPVPSDHSAVDLRRAAGRQCRRIHQSANSIVSRRISLLSSGGHNSQFPLGTPSTAYPQRRLPAVVHAGGPPSLSAQQSTGVVLRHVFQILDVVARPRVLAGPVQPPPRLAVLPVAGYPVTPGDVPTCQSSSCGRMATGAGWISFWGWVIRVSINSPPMN